MRRLPLLLLLLLVFFKAPGQATLTPAGPGEDGQERFFQADAALPLLIAAALQYSAELEKLDHTKNMAMEDLKIKRRNILSGIALGSGYSYGSRIGLGAADQQQQSSLNAFVLPAQAQYNLGVMVSLPLDEFLNRRNELQKQQMVIKQSQADRKIMERQIRQLVISQYQEIALARAQVKLHQEAFQTAHIHFKLAEKQFEKGEIPLSEMAEISQAYSGAAIAHNTSQVKYATALLMMEELTGKKIQDLMTQK
jgi:outer membrane protein TolC